MKIVNLKTNTQAIIGPNDPIPEGWARVTGPRPKNGEPIFMITVASGRNPNRPWQGNNVTYGHDATGRLIAQERGPSVASVDDPNTTARHDGELAEHEHARRRYSNM